MRAAAECKVCQRVGVFVRLLGKIPSGNSLTGVRSELVRVLWTRQAAPRGKHSTAQRQLILLCDVEILQSMWAGC